MAGVTLPASVDRFMQVTHALPDKDLEITWVWGDYEEGIRFAFFRVYEELRTLAAELGSKHGESSQPLTTARKILAQYHAAYRDLQAILLGVDETTALQAPAEDEWSVWNVLLHIIGAERGFFAVNLDAIKRERKQDGRPMEMTDEAWETFWDGDIYQQIMDSQSYLDLLEYYDALHGRILLAFQDISEPELNISVVFWEKYPMPLRFRLHRFDSHLRQHTIQVEKTLAAISRHPDETRRLLRLVYAALAEVEGALIGDPRYGVEEQVVTAATIASIVDDITPLLA